MYISPNFVHIRIVIFIFFKFEVNLVDAFHRIECTNFSAPVTVSPMLFKATPLLLDFGLLTDEQICTSRRKMPTFNKFHIGPASYITICEQCPQCYLTMPNMYELPLSWTLENLFVLTRQPPHHHAATDVPIYYVIVSRLPTVPIKNCRIFVPNLSYSDNSFKIQFVGAFFAAAFLVLILFRCFCIKTG